MSTLPKPTDRQRLKAEFDAVIGDIKSRFMSAPSIKAQSWQSTTAPQPMPEIFNYSFGLDLKGITTLEDLQSAIGPNLPWADSHFTQERISGEPKNPGTTWRQWPYARSADKHRVEGEEDPQFDHSYAERYWPKFAGDTTGGLLSREFMEGRPEPQNGIRSPYGDLKDLIDLLVKDPLTRQAYLPVWFPEDLYGASVEGRRVPCTLGYHFIRRAGALHCIYPMRSCDFVRHFRDDVYLTIRLLDWIKNILAFKSPDGWGTVGLGTFTMHITSLHMFESDRVNMLASMR